MSPPDLIPVFQGAVTVNAWDLRIAAWFDGELLPWTTKREAFEGMNLRPNDNNAHIGLILGDL